MASRVYVYIACAVFSLFLHPQLSHAKAESCKNPVANSVVAGNCHSNSPDNRLGMFNLFSKQQDVKTDVNSHRIVLTSVNGVLSENGPRAPATLTAECRLPGSVFISVSFPGYPMFVQNEAINVKLVSADKPVLDFMADKGEDLFEMRVGKKEMLVQIAKEFLNSNSERISLISRDQDGLEVRADFAKSKTFRKFRKFANTCLGMV